MIFAKQFQKARSVNQTSANYESRIATGTEPAGDAGTATGQSVIDLRVGGITAYAGILIIPYATGADNVTFNMQVLGWKSIATNGTTALWVPIMLADLALTASAMVGVAGKAVVNTERFADTIVTTKGNATTTIDLTTLANDFIAHVVVSLKGAEKVELSFNVNSSATDCNALYALL